MTPSVSSHPRIEFRATLDWDDITSLLIVEPDPESWMPTAQAIGQADLILDDLEAANVVLSPRLWLGGIEDEENLFEAEGRYTPIHLRGHMTEDNDIWVYLRDLLSGIARRDPYAVFGLMGATREDEIQRAAEVVAACGLRAVVLEPLCLSSALFWDVDAAVAEADRKQMARRVLTGEDETLLDNVLDEPDPGDEDPPV
jgi:hypothetical protein